MAIISSPALLLSLYAVVALATALFAVEPGDTPADHATCAVVGLLWPIAAAAFLVRVISLCTRMP